MGVGVGQMLAAKLKTTGRGLRRPVVFWRRPGTSIAAWSKLLGRATRVYAATEDARRKELILVTLLLGLIAMALAAFGITLVNLVTMGPNYHGAPPVLMLVCLALFGGLYWLRIHHLHIASMLFVGLVLLCGLVPLLLWGIALPQGLLMCTLAITVAGILIDSRSAVTVTLATGISLVSIAQFHITTAMPGRTAWHNVEPTVADAIGFTITFAVIALVAWLSNREIAKSLYRARKSERALRIERNSLEVKVRQRTKELERAQLEQILQLQRFAEFGRISSGMVHEIVNPLTAASINLEQVTFDSQAVQQARESLKYIERYVDAASRQLRDKSEIRRFAIDEEVAIVVRIFEYRLRKHKVKLELEVEGGLHLYGDATKFSQIVANLLANAIDAYEKNDMPIRPRIFLHISRQGAQIVVVVQDWGVGIPAGRTKKVFEPFYSTKQKGRGIGIGLALTKEIVEQDFGGSITVVSRKKLGTRFEIKLPAKQDGRDETPASN